MPSASQYLALLRQMGPAWVLYRAGYAMRHKAGLLRRAAPTTPWAQVPVEELQLRLPSATQLPPERWGAACVGDADHLANGVV